MTTKILPGATGVLVLADGTVLQGIGVGAIGSALGEVVFNTAMTGYQEILTDPSYMSQILAFTFPHVGNVGTNVEDIEQMGGGSDTSARGAIFRDVPTDPANWRSDAGFDDWMKRRGVVGLAGVDTRALTKRIRDKGAPHAVIAHDPDGNFDLEALTAQARDWTGLVGLDLAKPASTLQAFEWNEGVWDWPDGYPTVAGGKNVVPGPLEDVLRSHPLVSQAMVVGEGRPFVAALITLDPEAERPADPQAELQDVVDEANELVSKAEGIKKFVVLDDDFTEESGEMTATQKLKRHVIETQRAEAIEGLYAKR